MNSSLEILLPLLSIVFITNLFKAKVRNYYIAFLLLILITSVIQTLFFESISNSFTFRIYLLFTTDFYYGPLIYLYLCEIINANISRIKIVAHLTIPFVFALVHLLINTFDTVAGPVIRLIFSSLSSIWILLYFIIGILQLKRAKQRAKTRFLVFYYTINTYLIFDALIFVLSFSYFMEFSSLVALKSVFMNVVSFYYSSLQSFSFLLFCLAFFLYAITESLWLKKYMLEQTFEKQYVISKIDEETIIKDLNVNPRELDTKLTLDKYSKILKIPSETINSYCRIKGFENFVQFMNARRIENFKKLLDTKEMQQFSIDGLALKAGFKSRSTFYRIFKRLEGMSPIEYKEKIK